MSLPALAGPALKSAVIERIEDYFFSRDDVYARTRLVQEQRADGTPYEKFAYGPACGCKPGCMNGTRPLDAQGQPHRFVPLPVSDEVIWSHLTAKDVRPAPRTIGSYALSAKEQVKWICFDVDAHAPDEIGQAEKMHEAHKTLRLLDTTAREEGLPLYYEHSGAGLHAWCFVPPLEADLAHRAGRALVALTTEKYETLPSSIEVYPKQPHLSGRDFGNLVKVPYGLHHSGTRTRFITLTTLEPLSDQWQNGGLLSFERADAGRISGLATRWNGPIGGVRALPMLARRSGVQQGPPCVSNLLAASLAEGENYGRNLALFQLSVDLRRSGLPEETLLPILAEWNSRQRPPLPDEEFRKTVESTRNGRYSYGCEKPELAPYCEAEACPIAQAIEQRYEAKGVENGLLHHQFEQNMKGLPTSMPRSFHVRPRA